MTQTALNAAITSGTAILAAYGATCQDYYGGTYV